MNFEPAVKAAQEGSQDAYVKAFRKNKALTFLNSFNITLTLSLQMCTNVYLIQGLKVTKKETPKSANLPVWAFLH